MIGTDGIGVASHRSRRTTISNTSRGGTAKSITNGNPLTLTLALAAVAALTALAAALPAQAQDNAQGGQQGQQAQGKAAGKMGRRPAGIGNIGKAPTGGSPAGVDRPGLPSLAPKQMNRTIPGPYQPWLTEKAVSYNMATGREAAEPTPPVAREAMSRAFSRALSGEPEEMLGVDGNPGPGGLSGDMLPELGTPAGKASPVSPQSPQSPQSPNGGKFQAVFGADSRVRITPTTYFPSRAQCRIVVQFWDGYVSVGSGTLVGAKYVLTAGHVIHSKDHRGWARYVWVYPGQDSGYQPYGWAYATWLRSVTPWTQNADTDYDYALVTLNRAVGNSTGWFGLGSFSNGTLDNTPVSYVTGYPAEKAWGTQWQSNGPITDNDSTQVYYRTDTTGGQSGSGVYRFWGSYRYVFAVHTGWEWHFDWFNSGYYNRGTRITNARYYQILGWMNTGY